MCVRKYVVVSVSQRTRKPNAKRKLAFGFAECKVRHKKKHSNALQWNANGMPTICQNQTVGRYAFPSSSANFNATSRHWKNIFSSFLLYCTLSICCGL